MIYTLALYRFVKAVVSISFLRKHFLVKLNFVEIKAIENRPRNDRMIFNLDKIVD